MVTDHEHDASSSTEEPSDDFPPVGSVVPEEIEDRVDRAFRQLNNVIEVSRTYNYKQVYRILFINETITHIHSATPSVVSNKRHGN